MHLPLFVTPIPIPTAHLLKLAVDLDIPIYDDQGRLLEDFYIKDALSIAPIKIPTELLRSEVQNPDSNLNKTLALFYTYVQMREIAKLEKVKIKNEIERIEQIQAAFQQYLLEKGQSELIKQFWESLGDTEKEKQLLKKMEQLQREEMLHFLQYLHATTKARDDLYKLAESLNKSTEQLTQVLDERVQTAINVFEGERTQNLVEDTQETTEIVHQAEIEQKRLAEMDNRLIAARALHRGRVTNEVRELQQAIVRQRNAVANYEAMGKIAREYVGEQTNILIGQQATRAKMPEILRSHHVDLTELGPSGVATRAIFGTVIQNMKAQRDREAFRTKLDQLRGIVSDKTSIDPDSVIKPSDIRKAQIKEKLTSVLSVGADVEKREVGNIKNFKIQMRKVQENIDGLDNDLNKMTGIKQELRADKFGVSKKIV